MKKILTILSTALLVVMMGSCCNKEAQPVAVDSTSNDSAIVVDSNYNSVVDLPSIEAKTLEHFKDGEGSLDMKVFQEGETKVMLCTIPAGSSVGYHTHDTSMEVVLVESGTAVIDLDHKGPQTFTKGQAHYCAKGHGHSISNPGPDDLVIYNVVAAQ